MSDEARIALRDSLVRAGLLIATGVEGVFGRSGLFERIVEGFCDLVDAEAANDGAEVMRFPPVVTRADFERSGYMKSFPQLVGTVHAFNGNERDHATLLRRLEAGEDWTAGQAATGVVFTPAACYPAYPALAARGALSAEGALIDITSWCFRHEPSLDPARMQLFRQKEFVRVGAPDQVIAFRDLWKTRGEAIIAGLRLPLVIEVANDPFFGRAGRMLASSQREQALKFELLVPIASDIAPTACCSFNYHQDHFGHAWDIRRDDGTPAHTACVGFGLEHITLALLRHHGLDVPAWPADIRTALGL